ncbi:MAG: DUF370 domain-containing protein [Ruminococcaceae bacterium]|nr:DUF370 domain-containing protein [Oscillospiraceae bacterium]
MYISIGGETVLRSCDIVGVFDTDSVTVSKHSRDLLNTAEKEKRTVMVSMTELPRSFLLVREQGEIKLYLSPVAAGTLIGRIKKLK